SAAVTDIGKYLRVTRCLAVVGPPGQPPQMASQFCPPGIEPAQGPQIAGLLKILAQTPTDSLGGMQVSASVAPVLREMGLSTALGVQLTDKETQSPAGMLVVGQAEAREWGQSTTYFLQAIGDQMLTSVSHTKLRSLVRNLSVADEKTGLLGRSSYQDCLVNEATRSKQQGTPLSVVILLLDKGGELVRQHGEPIVTKHTEQLAQSLAGGIRQNDVAIKYLPYALAYILPDTNLEQAQQVAEKMRKISAGVRPPWNQSTITLSAAVSEANSRSDFESEDIVIDLINRAEFHLEEARQKGGNVVIAKASG
ncbi:MAG: diguanylate cyclase, partial [Acidobacteria bacterium]|nr:diguanylate cyclase [Acidobacteriota bacterium]